MSSRKIGNCANDCATGAMADTGLLARGLQCARLQGLADCVDNAVAGLEGAISKISNGTLRVGSDDTARCGMKRLRYGGSSTTSPATIVGLFVSGKGVTGVDSNVIDDDLDREGSVDIDSVVSLCGSSGRSSLVGALLMTRGMGSRDL